VYRHTTNECICVYILLTTKIVHFMKLSKCGTNFTIAFISSRRSKTYVERLIQSPDEGVIPPERCSVVGSSDPNRDFRQSEVTTGVGTSRKPEETCSGVWGYSHVGISDKGRDF